MPFVLLFIGLVLLIVGVRGKQNEFNQLMLDLFTGPNNLTFWAIAIISVGALGYIKPLRSFAIAFMALILVSLLVGNQKFFESLFSQIQQGTAGSGAQ